MNRLLAICAASLVAAVTATGQERDKPEPAAAEPVRALADRDPARRAAAAWDLARRGEADEDTARALEKALADESRSVRGRATLALWRTVKPPVQRVLPGLLAARNDPDEAVRAAADEAWAEIGPGVRAAMPFVKRSLAAGTDPQTQQKAVEALGKPGLEAVPAILDALADEQPGAVNNYAMAYWQVRTGYSYVAPSNNRFRDTAVQALAKVGPGVVPTLDEALADRSPTVREVAATALGRLGADAKPAVPTLIGLFKDRDPAVRCGPPRRSANSDRRSRRPSPP